MFRIRRIYNDISRINKHALIQVKEILASQFEGLSKTKIDKIPELLRNPFKQHFKSIVYVAEMNDCVRGFALLSHDPELNFCYLDYLAAARFKTGRGVGGALYECVREESLLMGATGLFFECLPDDPALCHDPEVLKRNIARLRFYEAYGARPIINTKYEAPVTAHGDNPPYLVCDGLGREVSLSRDFTRAVISAILTRKYKDICSRQYVNMVLASVTDDPVRLRPLRYTKKKHRSSSFSVSYHRKIFMVMTDQHEIHHVRERGYVESPVRIHSLSHKLQTLGFWESIRPQSFPEKHILAVHGQEYYHFFKTIAGKLPREQAIYPYVFPLRNQTKPPKDLPVRAGYYCIDTFTPLNRSAFIAAKRAVDCTLTAVEKIIEGYRLAYSLVRPPGHHAEKAAFGGFCYFNNAAIAAHYLSSFGKVAILDIDYHHGNGQQMIFYERNDVKTVSIHGHPSIAYPYFSGFANEMGKGRGAGYNLNFPLAEKITVRTYIQTLRAAIGAVNAFKPVYLIICLGLDTARGDPTGTWSLEGPDYRQIGNLIGKMHLPTLIVQEGGYNIRSIGTNAKEFFAGLWEGAFLPWKSGS